MPGNDLARVLCWGSGYTGGEDPLNMLRDVIEAEEIRLDRWTVVFHPEDKPEEPAMKAPSQTTGKKKKAHQAHLSQQTNQHHQLPALTSSDISGHLMFQNSLFFLYVSLSNLNLMSPPPNPISPTKSKPDIQSIELKIKSLCKDRIPWDSLLVVILFVLFSIAVTLPIKLKILNLPIKRYIYISAIGSPEHFTLIYCRNSFNVFALINR